MIAPVVLTVLLISVVTALLAGAVVRGGVEEDRARGFLTYRS